MRYYENNLSLNVRKFSNASLQCAEWLEDEQIQNILSLFVLHRVSTMITQKSEERKVDRSKSTLLDFVYGNIREFNFSYL